MALILVTGALGLPTGLDLFTGGWRWQAAATAAAEGAAASARACR
jgi:hypothetical protein